MKAQTAQATSEYCVLAVPLLVENGMNAMVDRVLVVDVDESTQLARASSRDNQTEAQIKNIIASQATREQRLAVADDVVNNEGSPEQTAEQVKVLHEEYLALAKSAARA